MTEELLQEKWDEVRSAKASLVDCCKNDFPDLLIKWEKCLIENGMVRRVPRDKDAIDILAEFVNDIWQYDLFRDPAIGGDLLLFLRPKKLVGAGFYERLNGKLRDLNWEVDGELPKRRHYGLEGITARSL